MGEWLSDNEHRSFPLLDAGPYALALDLGGAVELPRATLVDLVASFEAGAEPAPGEDGVYLARVVRGAGGEWTFVVATDADGVAGTVLRFAFAADAPEFATAFAEAVDGTTGLPPSAGSACTAPGYWEGYLTAGDLAPLAALMPPGSTATGGPGVAFEPAVVGASTPPAVRSVSVANAPRLTAGVWYCDGNGVPYNVAVRSPDVAIYGRCLVGPVRLMAGLGTALASDRAAGEVVIEARPGAGTGVPREEIKVEPGEFRPAGSPFYSGGPSCGEVLLTLNGLPGPEIVLRAGPGISIRPHPYLRHRLVISPTGKAACAAGSESSLSLVSEILESLSYCSSLSIGEGELDAMWAVDHG